MGRGLIYLVLILLAVSFLYPLFFMFANSIKTQAEYMLDPFSVDLLNGLYGNYYVMIRNFNILKYFANTLFTVGLGLVPVSYTHLDVYKRQGVHRAAAVH